LQGKVSILIPLYNAENFIADTIQSALKQTYEDIEIIIVDDGSTDNSYSIAKSFGFDKVKVYKQNNSGACAARNLAFKKSSGDYIQYLDADDLLAPDKIEQQMELFAKFGNNIVTSGIWGRFYHSTKDVQWEEQAINKDYSTPINLLTDSWNGKGMMAQHAWLIPRHIIDKAEPWNEALKINQDGEFFSRVIVNAKKIIFSPEAKVFYRSGLPDSISRSLSKEKAASLLYSFSLYVENLNAHLNDSDVRHALMMNFLNFIYQYYELYPELSESAKKEIYKLGYDKLENTGGNAFKIIASFIGFENSLKIRKFLQKKFDFNAKTTH